MAKTVKTDHVITGQLIFRQYGDAPDSSGRKIACLFGNCAVPEGHGFTEGHLHPICDIAVLPEHDRELLTALEANLGVKFLAVDQKHTKPVPDGYDGATVNQLLTAPIWKC
jgi:hypothetical protein